VNARLVLALAAWACTAPVAAQVTLYERAGYEGRSHTTSRSIGDSARIGFGDRFSSAVVRGRASDRWEVCDEPRYRGRCSILRPGDYPSLSAMAMDGRVGSVRAVASHVRVDDDRYAPAPPPKAPSEVVLFENEGFEGRSFSAQEPVADFKASGFNDRASSIIVRGSRWEVCENSRFGGRCAVLRPGQYASMASMGLNDRVSSVRALGVGARVDDSRYAPPPQATYDYGQRRNERLYRADVVSVRAVVDDSGQRCWVERGQVATERRSDANVPGALLGAVIGGVLGHQVGGGSGKDVATGIGAVAGAVIGNNVGRRSGAETTQDVQRCSAAPEGARPTYWDVTYTFRGVEHRVQTRTPPGATVSVNEQGEPRG